MHAVSIENHRVPHHVPDSKSSVALAKVPFNHYIDPFVSLLASIAMSTLVSSLVVINFSSRISAAAQVVFFRMMNRPLFDPLDPSFKNATLANFEKRVQLLQGRIDLLDQKFKQEHLIARDMQDFHSLSFEITETSRQLNGFMHLLQEREDHLAVEDDLKYVKDLYQDLDDQMDAYCKRQGSSLLDQFHKVLEVFTRGGIDLPDNIRNELIKTWKALDGAIKERLYRLDPPDLVRKLRGKLGELRDRMEALDGSLAMENRVGLAQPLKLRNIGNSCYLDSVFQSFACVESVCVELSRPVARDPAKPDEYLKKLGIQQELLQFLNVQKLNRGGDYTQMEFILFLLGGPSLYRLRQEIFRSALHPSLDIHDLTHQHDAAYVAEMMIDHFLPDSKFKMQETATTDAFPGMEWIGPVMDMTMLQVPLRPPKFQKIDSLIHWVMHKHLEKESDPTYQRKFDPKEDNVRIINPDEAAPVLAATPQKVPEFVQSYRFKELPSVLTLHFKRFNVTQGKNGPIMSKDERPVVLPEDGIVDLSRYYDAPVGAPKDAKYKVKSYVVHSGSYAGGHYVSYVEINGKYYLCDDLDSKCYKEISKRDFFNNKNAYLVVLERLPEDVEHFVQGG